MRARKTGHHHLVLILVPMIKMITKKMLSIETESHLLSMFLPSFLSLEMKEIRMMLMRGNLKIEE